MSEHSSEQARKARILVEKVEAFAEQIASESVEPTKAVNDIPMPVMPNLPDIDIPIPEPESPQTPSKAEAINPNPVANPEQSKIEPERATSVPVVEAINPESPKVELVIHAQVAEKITPEQVDISKPDLKAVEPEQKPVPLEPPKLIPKDVGDKFYFKKIRRRLFLKTKARNWKRNQIAQVWHRTWLESQQNTNGVKLKSLVHQNLKVRCG